MELRQLEYFVAVAEHGSFTQAARQCHTVQSALSHQVARLESELGTRLFARTSRHVQITDTGTALLAPAREALAAVARGRAEVAAVSGEVRGPLRIAAIPTVTAVDLPALIAEYARRYPDVTVTLLAGGSEDLVTAVRSHQADIAFLGVPTTWTVTGMRERELGIDELVVVVPPTHRLSRGRRRSLRDIAGETFVDLPAGTAGRRQTDEAFMRAGLERQVGFEVGSVEFVLDFVAQGLAIGLVPADYAARGTRGRTDLAIARLTDAPRRSQRIIWTTTPTPAAVAFLELTGTSD